MRRWICGSVVAGLCVVTALARGQAISDSVVLSDFEKGGGAFDVTKAAVVDSAELGGKAAKLGKDAAINAVTPKVDWTKHNFVRAEVFNAGSSPARVNFMFVDDSAPHGYYSWINRYISVRPGKSTVELYLPSLRRGEGSPKDSTDPRPFHWDKVQRLAVIGVSGEVLVDNVRVEQVDFPREEGVLAFDFGPADQAVLPLCTGVTPETAFDDKTGFGWTSKGSLSGRRRSRAPDTFVSDWISAMNSTFSVKVPDGKYRVWMMWEDPADWELYQNYTYRSVTAEGQPAIKETMDGKEFLDRYFHFAEVEDLPGDDIYARYMQWRYQPREFGAEVKGGRLDLKFDGSGPYAATVNGLVIYPEGKAEAGMKVIDALQGWRKHEFAMAWSEQLPAKSAVDPELAKQGEKNGFVVFSRGLESCPGIWDAPKAAEVAAVSKGFKVETALNEARSIVFTIHAIRDLADVTVSCGDFEVKPIEGAVGMKIKPGFDTAVQMVRYKFKNIGFGGAGVYGSVPWLLVDAKPVPMKQGTNRTYCITMRSFQGTPSLRGAITVKAGDTTMSIPLVSKVVGRELPEPDMGLSMFAVDASAPWNSYFPENEARVSADRERSLAYARQIGFTHITIDGGVYKGMKDGKPEFDLSKVKANYERVKKAGFTFIDWIEGGGGFAAVAKDKGDLAKKAGLASADELVNIVFGGVKAASKAEGLPEPIFTFGDEPPDTVAPAMIETHRRLRDLAGARSYVCWSPHGEDTTKLLDVTGVCSLNVATAAHFERATKAGNTLYLNNQGMGRWAYGLYMVKAHQAGVKAYQQFTWYGTHADPYYPLDSSEDDLGVVFPDRDGKLRPVFRLMAVQEGINDYRYALALAKAIAAAPAEKKAAAQEAQAFLNSVLEKVKFEDTRRDRQPQMTPAELDAFRKAVQDWLAKL